LTTTDYTSTDGVTTTDYTSTDGVTTTDYTSTDGETTTDYTSTDGVTTTDNTSTDGETTTETLKIELIGLHFHAGEYPKSTSFFGYNADFLFYLVYGIGYSCAVDYGDGGIDKFNDNVCINLLF